MYKTAHNFENPKSFLAPTPEINSEERDQQKFIDTEESSSPGDGFTKI